MTYALKLADDLFQSVRSGKKRCTVRNGRRDVPLGEAVLEATDGGEGDIHINIDSVSYTTLSNVPVDVCEQDGAANPKELLSLMRRFYPDILPSSEVTILRFEVTE